MQLNFSNESKKEIAVFGQYLTKDNVFGPFTHSNQSSAESLGVIPDSSFIFDKQMSERASASYDSLPKSNPILGFQGLCWPEGSHLSIGQNSAARLLTGKRKMDHITPVLASLHWLRFIFFCFNDLKLPSPTVCMQPF